MRASGFVGGRDDGGSELLPGFCPTLLRERWIPAILIKPGSKRRGSGSVLDTGTQIVSGSKLDAVGGDTMIEAYERDYICARSSGENVRLSC